MKWLCKKLLCSLQSSPSGYLSLYRKFFSETLLKGFLTIIISGLFFGLPLVANAAEGFDNQSVSTWVSNGTTWTYSFTVGSATNRYLLAYIFTSPSTNVINSVTYNGIGMTKLCTIADAASPSNGETIFYLANPSSGANNFTINQSNIFNSEIMAISYSGVAQSAPDAYVCNPGTAGATSYTNNITTVSANDWLVALYRNTDGGWSSFWDTTNANTLRGSNSDIGLMTQDSNGGIGASGAHNDYWSDSVSSRLHGTASIALAPISVPTLTSILTSWITWIF